MISKLRTLDDIPTNTILEKSILAICSTYTNKINELCDIINTIQKEREAERFEIQEWIGILEAVRKSVNIHEKQIDELQMKLEPEKCETPADNSEKANCQENVQQISYMAPGDITVFHGFNCSVEFDTPLPYGTRITIKSITKGGNNE